jgi:hypothetical protein
MNAVGPSVNLRAELEEFARKVSLSFPIATKGDFLQQMSAYAPTIDFAGVRYKTNSGARLIPSFFFPVADRDDLMFKVMELLESRGLFNDEFRHAQ